MTEEATPYTAERVELQRTDDWRIARLGLVTASRIADVMARTKSGYGASRANYMAELLTERLTGQPSPSFTNAAMQWGIDKEPEARAAYAARTGIIIEETGFIRHPTLAAGASPDGLVGDDGCVEIKCPSTATMLEYLEDRTVPTKYRLQMQWQMACTGRAWNDFAAYDPRLPEHLRLLIIREPRSVDLIAEITGEVEKFLAELEAKFQRLQELRL
jgi:putative phage-type endonuclease